MAAKKDGAPATEGAADPAAASSAPVGLSGEGVSPASGIEQQTTSDGDAASDQGTQPAGGKKGKAASGEAARTGGDDAPFTMTPSAWRKQIAERENQAQEKLAKDLGYGSVAEMTRALARRAATEQAAAAAPAAAPAAPAARPAKGKGQPAEAAGEGGGEDEAAEQAAAEQKALAPLREKLRREISEGRAYRAEARQLKEKIENLEQQFEVERSENALRDACRTAGVTGDYVDDVMNRLRKRLSVMTEDEINQFNEDEWIASLRDKHPFYFGVREQPANTGNADREPPGRPAPAAATRRAAESGSFNAMTASKKEVDARIAALGVPPPRTIN